MPGGPGRGAAPASRGGRGPGGLTAPRPRCSRAGGGADVPEPHTERSKPFFLLNRHRLGTIVAAGMRDFGGTHPDRSSDGLRLYDDAGRVLTLAGMAAGYMGEGPHGTLWVLRLCGFPEGAADAEGYARLERTAFGRRAFWLTAAAAAAPGAPGGLSRCPPR